MSSNTAADRRRNLSDVPADADAEYSDILSI